MEQSFIIRIINMFFGTTAKQRFRRLIIYTVLIVVSIMLIQNISYSKKDGLCWKPAATITVEK